METLFEADISVSPEATFEYRGLSGLRLGYFMDRGCLRLDLGAEEGRFEMGAELFPKAGITEILELIVAVQDKLEPETWPALEEQLAPLCSNIAKPPEPDEAELMLMAAMAEDEGDDP